MGDLGVVVVTGTSAPRRVTALPARGSVFLDFVESVYLGKEQTLKLEDIYRVNEITIATPHEASLEHRFLKV